MYNPQTKILETWALVYGLDFNETEKQTWFDQLTTLEQAKTDLASGNNNPFPLHIEKWTFRRLEMGDKRIRREMV